MRQGEFGAISQHCYWAISLSWRYDFVRTWRYVCINENNIRLLPLYCEGLHDSGCGGDKGNSISKSSISSVVISSSSKEQISSSSSSSQSSSDLQLHTLRIWPIGDSITAGASNNWGIWSPINAGYRRNLMLLLNDGYYYEFIGGTLDIKIEGIKGDALLDSIVIQRLK